MPSEANHDPYATAEGYGVDHNGGAMPAYVLQTAIIVLPP
jgi:hypothetical protein